MSSPVVLRLGISRGPTAGGTLVSISGSGFTGATAVDFGATPGTGLTVFGDSAIMITSPAGTGTVDVTVTTPGGTSATSSSDLFLYSNSPPPPGRWRAGDGVMRNRSRRFRPRQHQ